MLPMPARSIAASLRGFYLRSWRYGEETEQLAEKALQRERWTTDQWRAWQEEQLGRLLHRAATRVPYYRAYWEGRRNGRDRGSW